MLVKELIEQLQLVPQDWKVVLDVYDDTGYPEDRVGHSTEYIEVEQSGTLFYTVYLGNWSEEL